MIERIMYVCTFCADNNPEMCGRFNRRELRVMPDGRWLCENCLEEEIFEGETPCFPSPPEYVAKDQSS